MARRLSSLQTFTHKFIVPALWPLVWAFIPKVLPEVWNHYTNVVALMIGFWFTVSLGIYLDALNLKRVLVDDQYLYVSNYLKEISIPLSEISEVRADLWPGHHQVRIQLRSPSEFGDKIFFMPTKRFFRVGIHPVIAELRKLSGSANRPGLQID